MDFVTGTIGWIEVICGPMFSGKSEELIRRLRRARIARKRVQVFKPALDMRYALDEHAKKYSRAKGYTAYNKAAIREMFRQVGLLNTPGAICKTSV